MPKPGIPEPFKVLIKELQSLALDVRVLDKEGNEIDLKQSFDDDDDRRSMSSAMVRPTSSSRSTSSSPSTTMTM